MICQEGMKSVLFWLVHTTTMQHMEGASQFNLAHFVIFIGVEWGGRGMPQLHTKLILFCLSTLTKIYDFQGEPHTNRVNLYWGKYGINKPRACD
jgi:hypothetical protein